MHAPPESSVLPSPRQRPLAWLFRQIQRSALGSSPGLSLVPSSFGRSSLIGTKSITSTLQRMLSHSCPWGSPRLGSLAPPGFPAKLPGSHRSISISPICCPRSPVLLARLNLEFSQMSWEVHSHCSCQRLSLLPCSPHPDYVAASTVSRPSLESPSPCSVSREHR